MNQQYDNFLPRRVFRSIKFLLPLILLFCSALPCAARVPEFLPVLNQSQQWGSVQYTDYLFPVVKSKAGDCDGFNGKWDGGTYGIMTLTQDGNDVSGTYEWKGTQYIDGRVRGKVLSGTFRQPNYPEERFKSGRIRFVLAADGESWSGDWWDKNDVKQGTWSGRCIGSN